MPPAGLGKIYSCGLGKWGRKRGRPEPVISSGLFRARPPQRGFAIARQKESKGGWKSSRPSLARNLTCGLIGPTQKRNEPRASTGQSQSRVDARSWAQLVGPARGDFIALAEVAEYFGQDPPGSSELHVHPFDFPLPHAHDERSLRRPGHGGGRDEKSGLGPS